MSRRQGNLRAKAGRGQLLPAIPPGTPATWPGTTHSSELSSEAPQQHTVCQGFSGNIFAFLHAPNNCLSPPTSTAHTHFDSCPIPLASFPQASLCRAGFHVLQHGTCCLPPPGRCLPFPSSPRKRWQWHLGHHVPDGAADPTAGQRGTLTELSLFLSCSPPTALALLFIPDLLHQRA